MGSSSPPKPPKPIPPPPKIDDALIDEERERIRQRLAAFQGRMSTFLTGPLGLTSAAPVAQARLFGQ